MRPETPKVNMTHRISTFLCMAMAGPLLAQTTSSSDCNGSIQLCGGNYTETSSPTGTGNTYEFTGTCNLNLESSSIWYTFTVQESGNMSFILDPANDLDDYDWGMFNITAGGCAGINAQNGSSPEVACNSYGNFGFNGPTGISTANGGTGTSNGPGNLNGPAFNADLPVTAGQTYALVVMNWSNSPNGYTIDFTQSTASIYDDEPPAITSVMPSCNNQLFELQFSEFVVTNTVGALDFTFTSPSGTVIPLASATPIDVAAPAQPSYSLALAAPPTEGGLFTLTITSLDGNVEDLCGNVVLDTTFQIMLTAPLDYDLDITTACNGVGGAVEATWLSGGQAPVSFQLQGEPMPGGAATGLSAGNHVLTVLDAQNCQWTDTITVPDHALVVQVPQLYDSLSCSVAVVLLAGVEVAPPQDVLYTWSANTALGLDPAFSTSPAPEVDLAGIYTLIVTDPVSGCSDTGSVQIQATTTSYVDLSNIQAPNLVTPNGDGHNDIWRPFVPTDPGRDITGLFDTFELTVFNRWGQAVYVSHGGGPRHWQARDAQDGTYFYTMAVSSDCGAKVDKQLNGNITVLR